MDLGQALALVTGDQPPAVAVIGLSFLVVSSLLVFEFSPRRPVQYPFAFGMFAVFLVLGPRAVWIVLAATAAGALVRRIGRRRARAAALATSPAALVVVGVAGIVGIGVGHLVNRLLHVGYPVRMSRAHSLGEFMAIQTSAYLGFVAAKELGNALLARLVDGGRAGAQPGIALYAVGLVIGAPIQLAAQALYRAEHLLPWTLALGWTLLVNLVIGIEVERMQRNAELVKELASKEHLAAIGEVTARVFHHTRHQMGIIGMVAHQLERRLGSLPAAEAAAVAEELERLKAVQAELSQSLTFDLRRDGSLSREHPARSPQPAYASLLQTQSALLKPLAAERAIDVRVEVPAQGDFAAVPRSPVKLGQAFSNVLENAISAAKSRVDVSLALDGEWVVIRVRDDGPGMEPSFLVRSTEPFVSTKPGGSGMGLAITRAVVEEEEGELEIANREEGGLLVELRLPVFRAGQASMP